MKKTITLFFTAIVLALGLSASHQASAQQFCNAGFQYTIGTVTPNGATVTFYDSSATLGTITGWSWSFGNGTGSTLQNPVVPLNPGIHYVCLTITALYQNQPCTSTYCDSIVISSGPQPCNANFSYTNNVMGTQFNALGAGNTNWNWDFGDGNTSTNQNPVHFYTSPGTYQVCLTVSDALGTTCTSCQNVVIQGPSLCNASYTWFADSTGTVYFTNTSTGNPMYYSWNFGNGQTSNQQNPSYPYNAPGTYVVCLTIYDSLQSCIDTYCDSIIVQGGGTSCSANFSYQVSPNGAVFFSAVTQNNNSWTWSFGDGTAGTGANVSHTYGPGTYTVCLSVTTNTGQSCTSCQTITIQINALCSSNFVLYPDSLTPHTYWAVNLATGAAPISYLWSWGDGTSSTGAYPSHTYTAPGLYTICLTITDATGCTSTTCNPYQLLRLSGSNPITVNVIAGPTGVTEVNSSTMEIQVYPQPAINFINLEFTLNTAAEFSAKLYNLPGQMVTLVVQQNLAPGKHIIPLELNKLSKGIYILETQIGIEILRKKIVVQ